VSCIAISSYCCCFLVVFLAVNSLDFLVVRLLVTYARETLINESDSKWTERNRGVHSLGWAGREDESRRKFRIVVGECQWAMGLSKL
jgi:hypothetical protein